MSPSFRRYCKSEGAHRVCLDETNVYQVLRDFRVAGAVVLALRDLELDVPVGYDVGGGAEAKNQDGHGGDDDDGSSN